MIECIFCWNFIGNVHHLALIQHRNYAHYLIEDSEALLYQRPLFRGSRAVQGCFILAILLEVNIVELARKAYTVRDELIIGAKRFSCYTRLLHIAIERVE